MRSALWSLALVAGALGLGLATPGQARAEQHVGPTLTRGDTILVGHHWHSHRYGPGFYYGYHPRFYHHPHYGRWYYPYPYYRGYWGGPYPGYYYGPGYYYYRW